MVQPKFVELKTELILADERVLFIPSLDFDSAIGLNNWYLFKHIYLLT